MLTVFLPITYFTGGEFLILFFHYSVIYMFIGKEDDYHSLHGSIGMRHEASELTTINYVRSDLIYIMIICCLFMMQV